MTKQNDEAKNKNDELKDRSNRPTIVHETVPGEDPVHSGKTITRADKDKAASSTADEDTK